MPTNATPAGRGTREPKRPRHAHDEETNSFMTPTNSRASLTTLPIEIIAEILLYTFSPPTVLAVSRTCSFLYRFLAQNPAASFIWRGVRKTCKPAPLPDPGQCWKGSEAHYTSFVFGGGVCEVCRKVTRAMYISFAARIRLCGSWYCRNKFLEVSLVDVTTMFQGRGRHSLWVPYVESSLCFYPSAFRTTTWPENDKILLRKADWENFQLDLVVYRAAEVAQVERERASGPGSPSITVLEEDNQREHVLKRCHAAIERFPAIMELSARLTHWRCDYDREYKDTKKQNKISAKIIAANEGWNPDDLVVSQTYGSLQRRKTFLLEKIVLEDMSPVRSAIESELLTMQARRKRQKAEATYKGGLTEIKKIYERMRCSTLNGARMGTADRSDSTSRLILPPLNVFCTLPSACALKGRPDSGVVPPTGTSFTFDLKPSPLATSLIMSDLHTWLIPVQKHLMGLMGYPNGWQSASTRILPPLERVTARFFCQRCGEGQVGKANRRELCLDLKGVCSHVCTAKQRKGIKRHHQEPQEVDTEADEDSHGKRQEKRKRRGKKNRKKTLDWKVDMFERDDKAIRLIRAILELKRLSEEDPLTACLLSAMGSIMRCMTCQGWVVMDFDTAIGHAHRHEAMQVKFVPPYVGSLKDTGVLNDSVCRSVSNSQLAFVRGTSELLLGPSVRGRNLCKKVNYGCKHCFHVFERNGEVTIEKPIARAMNFNGLRSHVKEK